MKPICRVEFIQNLVSTGLTYEQSIRAYNSIMSTIADGVVNGQKIYFGQVGVLNPVIRPPRQVKMHFARNAAGDLVRKTREFFLDSRLKYSFRMFKKFSETHEMKWIG